MGYPTAKPLLALVVGLELLPGRVGIDYVLRQLIKPLEFQQNGPVGAGAFDGLDWPAVAAFD